MPVYDARGQILPLGRELARGGEGAVFEITGQAGSLAKLYLAPPEGYEEKLKLMLALPPEDPSRALGHTSIAWPQSLLYSRAGKFAGFVMPRVPNAVKLLHVFNPRLRAQTLPGFNRPYLLRTARNLAAALHALHDKEYVVGDLNESNVLVLPNALVTLIDTDSFQVKESRGARISFYPCPVGKAEYTPPELQGKLLKDQVRLPEHDAFALAVLIFQILLGGSHPFRSNWRGKGDPPPLEEKIRLGAYPHISHPALAVAPPRGVEVRSLYPALTDLFTRCFVDGHTNPRQRPLPAEWERALIAAEKNPSAFGKGVGAESEGVSSLTPAPAPVPVIQHKTTAQATPGIKGITPAPATPPSPTRSSNSRNNIVYLFGSLAVATICTTLLIFVLSIIPASAPRPTSTVPAPTPDLTWVTIPAGEFEMGSTNGDGDERPVHTVFLDAYQMTAHEITNSQYAQCVQAGVCTPPRNSSSSTRASYYDNADYANYPVIYVNWDQARAFCQWAGGDLPTEAQWEKAARGGLEGKAYPWGDESPVCQSGALKGANFSLCADDDTHAVGGYALNGYGLYDMAGNVWEWVRDWYASDYYQTLPYSNPLGPNSGDYRVVRGGSWTFNPSYVRVAYRYWYTPDITSDLIGFRCVRGTSP